MYEGITGAAVNFKGFHLRLLFTIN
jgi:hypothetical protein